MDAFTRFEHEGWERVAARYDSTWSSSTRQFISPLLEAAEVSANMSALDVGCGPGYVAAACVERGAHATGVDFSGEMVAIARRAFPQIEFRQGDAQNLPFPDASFDRVLATRFGGKAVESLQRGEFDTMVAFAPPDIISRPLAEVVGKTRTVPLDFDLVKTAKALGVAFGDN